MLNGRITGNGVYESGFGETLVGYFRDGVLDCDIGKFTTNAGETMVGKWKKGLLTGLVKYENERGDKFRGWFQDGLKHGRGHEIVKGKGEFKGFFRYGMKNDKGELLLLKRKKKKKEYRKDIFGRNMEEINQEKENKYVPEQADEVSKKYMYKYQGYLIADAFENGGMIMDTLLQTPLCLAKRDFTRTKPLNEYKAKTDQTFKRIKRITEKLNDMEQHIRLEMIQKKRRAFLQQKHYLKNTMRFDDEYGVDQNILDARLRVREHRFKKLDDACIKSDQARIPRLQFKEKDKLPARHLKAAFDRIHPSVPEDDLTKYDKDQKYPYEAGEVEKILPQIAISDFEEARERQALTKYDNMWHRAEMAYIAKKKLQNKTLAEAVAEENAKLAANKK